jgi:hypothetical protein
MKTRSMLKLVGCMMALCEVLSELIPALETAPESAPQKKKSVALPEKARPAPINLIADDGIVEETLDDVVAAMAAARADAAKEEKALAKQRRPAGRKCKAVIGMKVEGKERRTRRFNSVAEAARETDIPAATITYRAENPVKKPIKGWTWRWE